MKARDWLVKQGLAKQGRGRFSREARAALAKAISEGMSFSDFALAPGEVTKLPKSTERLAAMPIANSTPVRTQKVVWGIDKGNGKAESDLIVALDSCGACSRSVTRCGCSTGPKLPKWLGGGVALLSKPDIKEM